MKGNPAAGRLPSPAGRQNGGEGAAEDFFQRSRYKGGIMSGEGKFPDKPPPEAGFNPGDKGKKVSVVSGPVSDLPADSGEKRLEYNRNRTFPSLQPVFHQ